VKTNGADNIRKLLPRLPLPWLPLWLLSAFSPLFTLNSIDPRLPSLLRLVVPLLRDNGTTIRVLSSSGSLAFNKGILSLFTRYSASCSTLSHMSLGGSGIWTTHLGLALPLWLLLTLNSLTTFLGSSLSSSSIDLGTMSSFLLIRSSNLERDLSFTEFYMRTSASCTSFVLSRGNLT
jgi:hypothetical protein